MNPPLPVLMALRAITRHAAMTVATILGIAIGVAVICAVLIVDANTNRGAPNVAAASAAPDGTSLIESVTFERHRQGGDRAGGVVPNQVELRATASRDATRGEADYQAMRLAVRLAAVFAFLVGAVIVFYTMRYSVAVRARVFSLLLCLGESRRGVALSVLIEALLLSAAGTLLGALLAVPLAARLLASGISTNGRWPVPGFVIPWHELAAAVAIGIAIALCGVVGPVRGLYRLDVATVLRPRFLSETAATTGPRTRALMWLIPPALAALYLAMRPFLPSWFSVIHLFLIEGVVVVVLAGMALWLIQPILSGTIRAVESILRPILPLETLLAGKRLRLANRHVVFSVACVSLVFALLTSLHGVTRALKDEVTRWSTEAVVPYMFLERVRADRGRPDEAAFRNAAAAAGANVYRLSAKTGGAFPLRLVRASDLNPYRLALGGVPLERGSMILSRTLAAQFDLRPGDAVHMRNGEIAQRFEVIEVADDVGYFAEPGPYADQKSFALVSDGNPLFAGHLERSLGRYAVAWAARPGEVLTRARMRAFLPFYRRQLPGRLVAYWQRREIDRDFLIFDFILVMTVVLAGIGVANAMLIQVRARGREFAVLRNLGTGRAQVARLLLFEGLIIGLVGALFAAILGTALGALSVSFLDHFTLFDYAFRFSIGTTVAVTLLALLTCCVAAIYPAVAAARVPVAEALHYE